MTGFWGVRFQLPSWVQGEVRRRVTALASGMVLAAASLLSSAAAQAQSFTWNGSVSSVYNVGGNWTPTTAPVAAGQSAIFGPTAASVDVIAGPITPSSWTFTTNAGFYSISGAAVNFSLPGSGGGIINNANTGQTISINNNIGESVAGVQVQVLGNSTLKLTGTNTYSGGTTVSGFGTLQVGNNNSVGSGTVTLQDGTFQAEGLSDLTFANNFRINSTAGGSFIDAHSVVLTITGNITDGSGGAGMLTVRDTIGGGVVILTGTNTYSGGTTICVCGTLQLGDATHTGSIVGAVINEGQFNIVNANTAGITKITNDGGLTSFFGSNTAGTATIVNDLGETGFFNNSTAGSANITNRGGGATLFGTPGGTDTSTAGNATIDNGGGSATIFNASTNAGTAQITNHNFGITDFGDSSSAGSATIVNNFHGITNFGHSGGTDTVTAANAMITNNSGGETIFNAFSTAGNAIITTNSGGATFFFDNSTGGSAQFITNGTGFVDFSGSLGPNGDGRIAAGSIAGSGFYYIGAGNTLIVGSNNLSTEVSGVIADTCGCGPGGPGALTKVGTGTLTLSGINTYTGPTVVDGGILSVNGSIAS
ncbi:MAG TPA: autotransporter-associated beta strand repeat-containing protein, partial [Bradyrhizobium sp.]